MGTQTVRHQILNFLRWIDRRETGKTGIQRKTVVAGLSSDSLDVVMPVAQRLSHSVRVVTSHSVALDVVRTLPVDLIILSTDDPSGSLWHFVRSLRSRSCSSRKCALLLLARRENRRAAQKLVGRGVNAVLVDHTRPELIADATTRLLRKSRRVEFIPGIDTRFSCPEVPRPSQCLVVNVSMTGSLLECATAPRVGAGCNLHLSPEDPLRSVTLKSWVVRHAAIQGNRAHRFAIEFLPMSEGHHDRLGTLLNERQNGWNHHRT